MGNGWSCVKKLEATETPYLGDLNLLSRNTLISGCNGSGGSRRDGSIIPRRTWRRRHTYALSQNGSLDVSRNRKLGA